MTAPSDVLVGAADVGATKTHVAVVRVTQSRVAPAEDVRGAVRRFSTHRDAQRQVDAVADALRALAGGRPLAAAGVAAPGPLDAATGTILHSPNLGWRDHPFGPALAARLGVPVALEDDANAGALGEALAGAGAGRDPVLYVTLSSGVGAGLVVDGRLVRGAHQAAGEIGHLVADPAGPRCACGGRGHVEAFVGGAALARRAAEAWPAGRLADGRGAPADAAALLRLARAGEATAARIAGEAVAALALALAAGSAVLDPDIIVVGGSLGLRQRRLVQRAAAAARRLVIAEAARALAVVPAALGDRSPLAGAAIAAADLVVRGTTAPNGGT